MHGMNRVILCGRLGGTPELLISQKGKPYCRLRMATERGFLNKDDQWQEQTDWHSVFVWGALAERCCHNYRKGALLFVEGALTYWQSAQTPGREYKNAIHAERVNLIHQVRPSEADNSSREASIEDFGPDESLDNPPGARNHNAVAHPA
jgi:single-strand DNA-binding protein